ncbi:hypothetical protein DL98DRAFT_540398 [Cadophora sp. DSE1049]|nr:hypothetical protein DL98DRAFT_540398 [Cadophora sp. DSE1049]
MFTTIMAILGLLVILVEFCGTFLVGFWDLILSTLGYKAVDVRTNCKNCKTPERGLHFGFHVRGGILFIFPVSVASSLDLYQTLPLSYGFVMTTRDETTGIEYNEGPFCCLNKNRQCEVLVELVRISYRKPFIPIANVGFMDASASERHKSVTRKSFYQDDKIADLDKFLDRILLDERISTAFWGKPDWWPIAALECAGREKARTTQARTRATEDTRAREVGTGESGTREIGAGEIGDGAIGTREIGAGTVGKGQDTGEVGTGLIRATKFGRGEAETTETRTAQARRGITKEAKLGEERLQRQRLERERLAKDQYEQEKVETFQSLDER